MPPLWRLLLATVEEFDHQGGASLELVAWETHRAPGELRDVWHLLIDDGLLRPDGVDSVFGEEMYRITQGGRDHLSQHSSEPVASEHQRPASN